MEDANADEATANIIEYMQAVNPMQTPEGSANFGAYQIQWKAEPLIDQVDGVSNPQGVSLFQLGLYQTKINAVKANDPNWFDFTLSWLDIKKCATRRPRFTDGYFHVCARPLSRLHHT